MTIAAGFRCSDGVVICADTEVTLGGLGKFPESKCRFYGNLKCEAAFVYSGDRDFSVMAIDMIGKSISSAEQSSEDVTAAIRQTLIELYETYSVLPEGQAFILRALVCLWISGTRSLFSINGPSLAPVSELACIGAGEYLGAYVARTAFDATLNIREAIHSAAYLLFCAKECVPGCGGKSQIMTLRDRRHFSGRQPMFHQFFEFPLEDLEAGFKNLHTELRNVVLGFGNLGLTKRNIKRF